MTRKGREEGKARGKKKEGEKKKRRERKPARVGGRPRPMRDSAMNPPPSPLLIPFPSFCVFRSNFTLNEQKTEKEAVKG